MKITAAFLRSVDETTRYPALLARLSKQTSAQQAEALDPAELLTDLLEPPLRDCSDEELLNRYLEDGEIAAARLLISQWQSEAAARNRLIRVANALKQELEKRLRDVMGLLLLLQDMEDGQIQELREEANGIEQDRDLQKDRPGAALRRLEPLQQRLEALLAELRERITREAGDLEQDPRSLSDPDAALALRRLKKLLNSQEGLPAAQRMLTLVRRAQAGRLNPEDLQFLHQAGGNQGRLVRPWSDFTDTDPSSAADILDQLADRKPFITFSSDFDAKTTIYLFRALVPKADPKTNNELIITDSTARALGDFLNLKLREGTRNQLGSSYFIEFARPRVPAFNRRTQNAHFPGGIQLVVPLKPGADALLSQFLQRLPEGTFPVVYYPGRLKVSLEQRLKDKVAYFDNIDLLRLAECPKDQREHAFQQVILPRSPLERVAPYQAGGPVATEMFRGRHEILDRLKSPSRGTVLFSGRMMGKSSILTKIHDDIETNRQTGKQPATRCVKISNSGVELLRPLVQQLAQLDPASGRRLEDEDARLIPTPSTPPQRRREMLRERLSKLRSFIDARLAAGWRLFLLIDEADKFAADDAERPREESLAWLLRDLEFDHPDKLRVIFAGFQTIHRQVISSNGAFAHWYGLVQLGPLDEEDATALVREPFEDFGFVFASDAGVSRILEFTGRHPLLIQETCARLMQRMEARRIGQPKDEVIQIYAGDVETVCRDDQLRNRLKQVLDLNLNEYPRLKLVVYLILMSRTFVGSGSALSLDEFRLSDVKNMLLDWYGDRLNEYFDQNSIGALVQELMALGLLVRRGDSYEFVNRTFAAMIRDNPRFEADLSDLLIEVTQPKRGEAWRFYSLPNEYLERLVGAEDSHCLVVGLPGTLRTSIAHRLFEGGASLVVKAAEFRTEADLHETLRRQLEVRRKTLSTEDLVVKSVVETLVLDDTDQLEFSAMVELAAGLAERKVRLIAFGGAPLARQYLASGGEGDFEVFSLKRLRPVDIKAWGERLDNPTQASGANFQIIFDPRTSERLHEVTDGYFPLVQHFKDYCRTHMQNAKEYLPGPNEVADFAERILSRQMIEHDLLNTLNDNERKVLEQLYCFASEHDWWRLDWDTPLRDHLIPRMRELLNLPDVQLIDILDLLHLMDLLDEDNDNDTGKRYLEIKSRTVFAKAFS